MPIIKGLAAKIGRKAPRHLAAGGLALGLALLLASAALPSAALAAGEEIHVFANDGEARFPGDVVFNLGVEGPAEIVEVRLYYRVPPSPVWMYAYPQVTPSRRVETRFDLDLSGAGYLPPGTELEYYYTIRDSQSGVLETERKTFLYVDDRFHWRTSTAGPLTIFWHDLPDRQAEAVARSVETSLADISALLDVRLDRPVRGIIYNSRSEARGAFPNQSRTTTDQGVFQGYAFPERGVFVGVGLSRGLIVHESAHLLLEAAVDSPMARIPAWLNEGFASYVESGSHGEARGFRSGASPTVLPLRHMQAVSGTPQAIAAFYRKAESVVEYLLETHGAPRFREFLGRLDRGEDADRALRTTYGFDVDGLDRRWASGLSGAAGEVPSDNGASVPEEGVASEGALPGEEGGAPSGGRLPFQYFDTLLIGMLAVVAAAAISAGFLLRKLRSRASAPLEGERLTEDEWEERP
jgi:hypothetical protein